MQEIARLCCTHKHPSLFVRLVGESEPLLVVFPMLKITGRYCNLTEVNLLSSRMATEKLKVVNFIKM